MNPKGGNVGYESKNQITASEEESLFLFFSFHINPLPKEEEDKKIMLQANTIHMNQGKYRFQCYFH